MGQTDIHRLSEIIVCPVLRITLKLHALRNLNADERNFPGIDLGDSQAGVGIQVTATADAAKIRATIQKCIRHQVYKRYPRLRFFVLTEKQSIYRLSFDSDLEGKLSFDPRKDVLDYKDILTIVSTLPAAEISAVDHALEADLGSPPKSPLRNVEPVEQEVAWLNLLPLTLPSSMYLGELVPEARPRGHAWTRNPRDHARRHLHRQELRFAADWTVYDGQVMTFHDLRQPDLPLARLVDAGTVTELPPQDYHEIDDNYRRAFKSLLRFCLQQLLYPRGVFWQHKERLFCFGPRDDQEAKRYESWTTTKRATRVVFERVPKRNAPDETYCYKHLAFRATFHSFGSRWYMSVKPEWFFSFDGYNRWFRSADSTTFLKRKEKNQHVFNHVKFIAHFLRPRRNLDLFTDAPVYRFLTFGQPAALPGLPRVHDDDWRSIETKSTGSALLDPEGVIPLKLEGM